MDKLRAKIEKHIAANWTLCPVVFPNTRFEEHTTPYIVINYIFDLDNTTIGSECYYLGIIDVKVRVKKSSGVGDAMRLFDNFKQMIGEVVSIITFNSVPMEYEDSTEYVLSNQIHFRGKED